MTEGSHCSVCNKIIVAQTTVQKTHHTIVRDAAVAATCNYTGLTEGSHCSICNKVIIAQTTTQKTNHTPVTDAAVAATCKNTGLTEGSHCSVCNEVIKKQLLTEPLPHDYDNNYICKNCNTPKTERELSYMLINDSYIITGIHMPCRWRS